MKSNKISWKQGLVIALGVPMLILPNIGYFAGYVGVFSIIVWMLSISQGFLQNIAYGDFALMYPEARGLPGYVQAIFKGKSPEDYDINKFIGGFSAWGYWMAWNPVLAIFSLLIGTYLHGMIPALGSFSEKSISLVAGAVIFTVLIIINRKGLSGGAMIGNILAVVALIPLVVLSIVPIVTGQFQLSNITAVSLFPETWSWDVTHILILLGIMAMAQWSACAWETAAVYAPDYEKPKKDLPKALFFCGLICLVTFVLVQTACVGTLGIQGILEEPYSPMLLMAKMSFGNAGAFVTVIMLMASMILIIQTALLGSSQAMQSMAVEGNLPKVLAETNKYGVPVKAMISIAILNFVLIFIGTPSAIVAGSAMGYVIANGITLFAYFKAKGDQKILAPKWWKYVGLGFCMLNIPLYLAGIFYINKLDYGMAPALIGVLVLFLFVPFWLYARKENTGKKKMLKAGVKTS
ncbi:APC family permease [Acetobacterium bakii]|uniref:Amino acid permease n=1 Tax=Acetobacterium bakii TaxID=52689 RepID=A0A0L6U2D0_9FIRM|nr:APC family permease [Acetobacterium bakii]KNZ42497.1 amino acid permease [Acetobacterium bakii]